MGEWDDSADNKKNLILPLSQSLIVPPSQSLLIPSPIFLSSQNQPTREDTLSSHATITAKKIVANTALGVSNYLLMVVMLCYSITFSSDVRISALPIEVMFTSSAVPE